MGERERVGDILVVEVCRIERTSQRRRARRTKRRERTASVDGVFQHRHERRRLKVQRLPVDPLEERMSPQFVRSIIRHPAQHRIPSRDVEEPASLPLDDAVRALLGGGARAGAESVLGLADEAADEVLSFARNAGAGGEAEGVAPGEDLQRRESEWELKRRRKKRRENAPSASFLDATC